LKATGFGKPLPLNINHGFKMRRFKCNLRRYAWGDVVDIDRVVGGNINHFNKIGNTKIRLMVGPCTLALGFRV
jgi:hypothetical protein